MQVEVSVIIPCYNVETYIEECLQSVLNQTYKEIEIICVDNNSTDNTYEILCKIIEKHPNIQILRENKSGAPFARNMGLKYAKGEWIQFLDADDLLKPDKIEHQVSVIINNPDMPFIAGACLKQNIKGEMKNIIPLNDFWKGLFVTNLGNTCANLFNKEKLQNSDGWNTNLKSSQEYDLMFKLLKTYGEPVIDEKPLTIIRERESGQISQGNNAERWIQYLNLRIEIIDYLKENKKIYYQTESDFFNQELFSIIRTLYPYQNEIALTTYNKYLGKNFKPIPSKAISSNYCKLFNILGFKKTESLKSVFK